MCKYTSITIQSLIEINKDLRMWEHSALSERGSVLVFDNKMDSISIHSWFIWAYGEPQIFGRGPLVGGPAPLTSGHDTKVFCVGVLSSVFSFLVLRLNFELHVKILNSAYLFLHVWGWCLFLVKIFIHPT